MHGFTYSRTCWTLLSACSQRLALRLAVRVGSINEEENQRGVAHIIEHLAFRATRNFENFQLIDFFESIGAAFGACQNAYTSFDETVYILNVPTDRPGLLRKAIHVIHEWSTYGAPIQGRGDQAHARWRSGSRSLRHGSFFVFGRRRIRLSQEDVDGMIAARTALVAPAFGDRVDGSSLVKCVLSRIGARTPQCGGAPTRFAFARLSGAHCSCRAGERGIVLEEWRPRAPQYQSPNAATLRRCGAVQRRCSGFSRASWQMFALVGMEMRLWW
eukprot:5016081-Pleurochrysis_carterae.AAC.3